MARIRTIILLIIIALTSAESFASHFMGGEITWECLPNGRFRFTMKLYRECSGIQYNNQETLKIANCPVMSNIIMNLFPGGNPHDGDDGLLDGKTDLSPDCWDANQEIKCPTAISPNTGAIEEWYYTSDGFLALGVPLIGVPPPQGWIFYYDGFARNPSTNLFDPTNTNWCLRAVMYPYQGQSTFPCFDNSPVFAEPPITVTCTGNQFTYNPNAFDKDLDILKYDWAPALSNISIPVVYEVGYSYDSPTPGPAFDPANEAAVIDTNTGEISFKSNTSGAFLMVSKVTSYRCGIKIAEIFREMQTIILSCPNLNNAPTVPGTFYNPNSGLFDTFAISVYAGDSIDFDFTGTDLDLLPNGNPNTVYLESSSIDYGTNYSDENNGCPYPPCATLTPPPPISNLVGVNTHFHWNTSCDHIYIDTNCYNTSNIHNFYFKVYDNACPANAIKGVTVSIEVLPPPIVDAPELKCTEVVTNGNVTLTWVPPLDPANSFSSYNIYYSNSLTGPFTEIATILNYGQTSYTHIGAGANTLPRYYYITTKSSCYGSFYALSTSDTIASIHLDVIPDGTGQVAQLSWNPVHNPLLSSSYSWYMIYREFPIYSGNWMLIDSTQNTSYYDTLTVCDELINYRIEISDTTGCTSVSSRDNVQLLDNMPPATPILDYVTLDPITGKAKLSWQPSTSTDTEKYGIYRQEIGPAPTYDTSYTLAGLVTGRFTTTFTDPGSSPQTKSETYKINAFDSCGHPSSLSPEQNTIFLEELTFNLCIDKILLDWNSYRNWVPALQGYKIYFTLNGKPDTINLGSTGPNQTTTFHYSPLEDSNYCYYVQAYNGTFTSESNQRCLTISRPLLPRYLYIRGATVIDNEYSRLRLFTDSTALIKGYSIYRSEDGINYYSIGNIQPSPNAIIEWDDLSAEVSKQSYYYKAKVIDSCGNDVLTSNIARTIFLNGNSNTYMSNHLLWTPYEDRDPLAYNIMREIEELENFSLGHASQWGEINYDDNVAQFSQTSGRFYYYVEAPLYDVFLNEYPFSDTVVSNTILLIQKPRVYIPNAFAPQGHNFIFKPVGAFIDREDFYMGIFNRWGELLYESHDLEVGWDGTYMGEVCPFGMYAYYIRVKLSDGEYFNARGAVMLIR